MVTASDWVGFTLPGMMELPGSFSGMVISPMPERGPEASQRMSLAILLREAATVLRAPWACTRASWLARASNLLGAVTKGRPVSSASFAATRTANSGCALRPVPTAVPPRASSQQVGQRGLEMLQAVVELGHVARELLAQGQGRRVLQMGAADLHDVREGLGLRVKRVAQVTHVRDDLVLQRLHRGHVHGRREDVVAGLALVHVVVGVDEALLAPLARPGSRWRDWPGPRSCSCCSGCRCPSARPTRGNSWSCFPARTSSAAATIALPFFSSRTRGPCSRGRRPS